MAHDAYAPCPCGSGKKLKFCCGEILPELQRAQRLLENQPDAAEQLLRSLHARHPEKESVLVLLAEVLQRAGRLDELRALLLEKLRNQPDHPSALLGLAELCLIEDGFEASRRLVHRAFQLCARSHPNDVAMLAHRIAAQFMETGCLLAVREHLALAARLSNGSLQQQAMMRLAGFERSSAYAWPLRGSNPLMHVEGAVATQEQDQRARKLCLLGCFEPAAILYERMAQAEPDNGAVWYNLGLTCAWDGRHADAVPALRKAATLLEDQDLAAEAEALAQMLENELSGEKYSVVMLAVSLRSASEALSRLDDDPRLFRIPPSDDEDDQTNAAAGRYEFLSMAPPDASSGNEARLPQVSGEVFIIDVADSDDEDDVPLLEVSATDDVLPGMMSHLRALLGDLITTPAEDEKPVVGAEFPAEQLLFDHPLFRPEWMSEKDFRSAQRRYLKERIDTWLNRPHPMLNGRTPRDAAADPELRRALKAAVMNLHAHVLRAGDSIDVTELLSAVGLSPGAQVSVPASALIGALPGYRFMRVSLDSLSDAQLADFTNRVAMMGLSALTRRCLDAMQDRSEALSRFGEMRAALTRAAIARDEGDYERVWQCLEQAREYAAQESDSFRQLLEIDVRELSCRLDAPDDPRLVDVLHRFRDRYFRKIPEISELVRSQLVEAGCSHLLPELDLAVTVGSSLWTGSDAPSESRGGSRLWLPGQE